MRSNSSDNGVSWRRDGWLPVSPTMGDGSAGKSTRLARRSRLSYRLNSRAHGRCCATAFATIGAFVPLLVCGQSLADDSPPMRRFSEHGRRTLEPVLRLRTRSSLLAPGALSGHGLLTAQADEDEPTAPGGSEPSEPSQQDPGSDEEPLEQGSDEPERPEEPLPPAQTVVAKARPAVSYGLGFQLRAIFVPEWFLGAFVEEGTSLTSMALGAEAIRRKGNFDLIGSIDFGFYSAKDGNYLGKGDDPRTETDFVQFDALNVLAFSVHFIWHHEFMPWFSLVYGAGVGMGIVLGDIIRVSNDPDICRAENAGNEDACYPKGVNPATRAQDLTRIAGTCTDDGPGTPCPFKEEDVWPVVPIVHLLLGVNFKISEQFSVRVDGGFRDAFYFGAAGHYFL